MIRKILFTTDFSVLSQRSLAYAVRLAHHVDASILGMYCLKLPNWLQDSSSETGSALESLKSRYEQRLQRFFEDPRLKGLQVDTRLCVGIPEQMVQQTAVREDIDLVLVSKYSRTDLERFFVGSVTEKILRESSRPVLVVPSQDSFTVNWAPILCAVDFSVNSKDALQFAIRLAQDYNSSLVVIHVIETRKEWKELEKKAQVQLQHFEKERDKELREVAGRFGAGGETRIRIEKGHPGEVLLQAARELGSDLLILGARGHWIKKGMGTGSTVNGLIRNANLPIVVVPS